MSVEIAEEPRVDPPRSVVRTADHGRASFLGALEDRVDILTGSDGMTDRELARGRRAEWDPGILGQVGAPIWGNG